MPIISRSLDSIQQTTGGIFAAFLCVDSRGHAWGRSRSRFVDEAAAQAAVDVYDWTSQLRERDFNDLLIWVQAKNTVASFDLTGRDVTEEQGEDFIAGTFAESPGNKAIRLAWWIESLNPPSWTAIRSRIGWTNAEGSDVQDRAISLTEAEPLFDTIIEVP